jgi:hypothetical protein
MKRFTNPASIFCVEQGGRSDRGMCIFPDGRKYDEWQLFRQVELNRLQERKDREDLIEEMQLVRSSRARRST